MGLLIRFAGQWVAGERMEDAIRVARAANARGIEAVINHLGEHYKGRGDVQATLPLSLPGGPWVKVLDSSDARWGGPGGSAIERPEPRAGTAFPVRPRSFILLLSPGQEAR